MKYPKYSVFVGKVFLGFENWTKKCPKNSKFSDQYNKIIVEAMGGSGDNDLEKEEKIIRNISKTIVIDK